MGAHAQALGNTRPTAATVLGGIGRWHSNHLTPSVHCFGFKDDAKCRPARITDALAELSIPYHVGDPQIFEVDRVEVAYEGVGGLVMEVGALALHFLLLARPQLDRLLAALAALLAPGDAALGFLEPFLRFAVMARVVDRVTLSGDD